MWFGIPKETDGQPHTEEKRVAISPAGVRELVEGGAQVLVESGAGAPAGFLDEAYRKVGAKVVYSHEEAIGRADMVVKIGRPTVEELELMQAGAGALAFWHLAVRGEAFHSLIANRKITAIGYEVIQDGDGTLPILKVSSEIAGKMAPQIAGRLLETTSGGIGILMGGAPGIPPADVVILGAGTLGYHAARGFMGLGCSVYVLDISQSRLESIDRHFNGRVVTAHATKENLEKFTSFAEVVVGAVLVPGEIAPIVVTVDMVKKMRPGSVILDFSFDQGGCVETTRLQGPTGGVFVREGVLHFAVPNCPSYVARTSSHAMTYALLPFLTTMQQKGLKETLKSWADLRRGCYTYEGQIVSPHITKEPADLNKLLGEG
jgi:alanine dehydrogenase